MFTALLRDFSLILTVFSRVELNFDGSSHFVVDSFLLVTVEISFSSCRNMVWFFINLGSHLKVCQLYSNHQNLSDTQRFLPKVSIFLKKRKFKIIIICLLPKINCLKYVGLFFNGPKRLGSLPKTPQI